jgi:hypothetical protein
MNDIAGLGRVIVVIGIVIVVFGIIVIAASRFIVGRGGPLPGDIVIRRDHVTIYFPIISSIVISIILTLILWLVAAFRR